MDSPAFKRSAKRTLLSLGFEWVGHSFRRHDSDVWLAGATNEADQPRACEELLQLAGVIDAQLRALGTEAGLRNALSEGRLEQGLVWKHAREWLEGEPSIVEVR